jgi:ribose transport system substrate-binding protein
MLALGLVAGCRTAGKRIVGVVPMGRSHLYWQSIHAGAVAASWDNGVDILWNGPAAEVDYAAQLQIVESMINRRLSAIALAPIDSKALVEAVQRAVRASIPVIIFDSPIDTDQFTAQIATDNYGAGRMAAGHLASLIKGKGTVVIVASQPGSASSSARERGFEDVIRESFPGIRIVDKRFGMADFATSLKVAENMLTGHQGLSGVFASNEPASVGAARAIKARRARIRMVGFDWSPALLDELEAGIIDALVAQNPFRMGYEAVVLAIRKLNGQPFEKLNRLAPRLLTRENLHTPDVQTLLRPDLTKYLR